MTSTLAELGEAELLKRLARFAPPGQLDDDTACLASDARPLLVNTDVLVWTASISAMPPLQPPTWDGGLSPPICPIWPPAVP